MYLISRISGSGESETTGWWMDTPCRLPTSGGVCLPTLMQFMKTVRGILSSSKVRKRRQVNVFFTVSQFQLWWVLWTYIALFLLASSKSRCMKSIWVMFSYFGNCSFNLWLPCRSFTLPAMKSLLKNVDKEARKNTGAIFVVVVWFWVLLVVLFALIVNEVFM